ncbi:MAG: ABC transporter permease, partial [Acutalibacteraceae bacterium]
MRKDLLRSIKKSITRFISIVAIVALGISFFVGIKSASPDMRKTANEYFIKENLLDLQVISTIGFTDDEVKKIESIDGVDCVSTSKITDTLVYANGIGVVNVENGAAMTCRVMSMDFDEAREYSETGKADNSYINRVKLIDGRYPENSRECLIDNAVAASYPELMPGNVITLGGDATTLSDTLNTEEFTIVGTVSTPMYVSFERGSTNIGSGTLGMYIYIDSRCFVSDNYTAVFATVDNKENYDVYTDEYTSFVTSIGKKIEDISQQSISKRLSDVKQEYSQKIADGEEAYAKLEKETTAQLEEYIKKIDTIENYIKTGDSKISAEQANLDAKVESAEKELESAKKKYEQSLKTYEDNNILAGNADSEIDGYNKAKELYNTYLKKQQQDKAEIDELKASRDSAKATRDSKKKLYETAESAYSAKSDYIAKK